MYKAAKSLREASGYYLNFNFELLNGCKFKCPGCHVEKEAQEPIADLQNQQLMHLLSSSRKSGYKPWIAFIGPTDFLVADNFEATFSDPRVIEIFKQFTRISLQTTYLDIKNKDLIAQILNKYFSDVEIEINIVVDPAKIMDDKYLERINSNKISFLNALGRSDVRTFGIMNIYDYDKTKIPELLRNYDFMHHRVQHLFQTTIDYNFSAGRNRDLSNQDFFELSNRIKKLFNDSIVSDNQARFLRFSFGKLTDSLVEKQFNYRSGEVYYSPLMYERFVTFRPELKVPLEKYEISEVEDFEKKLQMEQFSLAPQFEECETCPYLASCVDRGILKLMGVYDIKSCLIAKKALATVNSQADQVL